MSEQPQTATGGLAKPGSDGRAVELPHYDLVCYLLMEWDILPRRPHLTALAQFGRVLLVQVPMNISSPLLKPRKFLRWLSGRDRLSQLSETLFLARPWMAVPYGIGFRYPWLRRINRWLVARPIRGFVRRLGFQAKAALIFDPAQAFLSGLAEEKLLCYEIVDEYAGYPGMSLAERKQIVREEAELLRRADIVFVPRYGFYEEKSRFRSHIYRISNTADVDLFARAQAEETPVPADLERIPGARIGYIGNINDLMDCELLNYLADRHPEWSFVFLGRVDGTRAFRRSQPFKILQQKPNVHFLGWRDYTMLPNYLKGVAVCIIPWSADRQPNKLYQYLAAGKPVVATDWPQVRAFNQEHGQLIDLAETHEEFEQLLASALSRKSDETAVQERMRISRLYSAERMAWERIRRIADFPASTSADQRP